MLIKEHVLRSKVKDVTWSIYVLGDLHIGAPNCAEDKISSLVQIIKANPNARFFLGGDICDFVILNDAKRFDPTILPDWMLDKDANGVRSALTDMVGAQINRTKELLAPIKDRCLGAIEGNHEYSIKKYHGRNTMLEICDYFNCDNLTDCAFVRLNFRKGVNHSGVRIFITHGHGGGRTSGAEPNSLYRLAADKECEVVLKGHSHTFCIHPPIPMLTIPGRGVLPENPHVYDKFAANWGAFVYTYQVGPSTYASRANFPLRPMYTAEVRIQPFVRGDNEASPHVEVIPVKL